MGDLNTFPIIFLIVFLFSGKPGITKGITGKKKGIEMAIRMADSEIIQFSEPWTVNFNPIPVWNYTQGLIAYSMALVDVLDYLPLEHPGRMKILAILNQVASGIIKYQERETGVWFQVIEQGKRDGNYPEATASSMFVCSLLKATWKGYLNKKYKSAALKAHAGILKNLVETNDDQTIRLTKCCSVAGLGGNPYRDGSFGYYISEPVRNNDPKGVGPFILASLELDKIYNKLK